MVAGLLLVLPRPSAAAPPFELPIVRLRVGIAEAHPVTAGPEVEVGWGIEVVWTLRGPPRPRSRVPPPIEGPWVLELRRFDDPALPPSLPPELDPLPPENPR